MKEEDSYETKLLRSLTIRSLGMSKYAPVLEEAQNKFRKFLRSETTIHPDLRDAVFSIGARFGNAEDFNAMFDFYKKTEVEDDGLTFDVESVNAQDITQQSEYVGLRVLFKAKLDSMILNMQVDMGFGDAVYPAPASREVPPMLDFPPPQLLCYQPETSIAEKFHAMVQHDMLNSRMKDFYDIREIGAGSYGKVRLVELHDNLYAVKQVSQELIQRYEKVANVYFERDVMQAANNPSIP